MGKSAGSASAANLRALECGAMKIQEIMTPKVQCVRPENTLVEAAGVMRKLNVGAVPVRGENDKLLGMLTDRDICVRAVADGRDPSQTKVEEALSPGIIYAMADQDVDDAIHVKEKYQIRRLPVLNAQNRLAGIIALADIAAATNRNLVGEVLQEVSAPGESGVEDPATR